ncbi:putative vomeronasal receptor-like protein 4 [Panthera tigris]|uniref:putative vomeronasal receptor-like protein 4 n=1 Tax=Panthera tigris TaxID=9694 RepID=UPI001C6F950B|nr:putative vomeronasal receptor-like protein 4 [Panthera tigris]
MMTSSIYMTIKIGLFLQVGIVIFVTTFFLLFHIFTLLLDYRPKSSDMIICLLALVHIMKLFTERFLLSTDLFEVLNFLNGFKSKALFFMITVSQRISVSNTCLLTILQAIIISPRTFWLARFKHKYTKYIFCAFIILWFLSLSLNSNCLLFTAASNVTQSNLQHVSKYCSFSHINAIIRKEFFTFFLLSRDVSFIGVMLLSIAYMVILLSRPQRQCQNFHSTSLSSRVSSETRATKTILLLIQVLIWYHCMLAQRTPIDFSCSVSLFSDTLSVDMPEIYLFVFIY